MPWRIARRQTIILLYHRIASVTPDPWSLCVTPKHFEEHLQVLRRYRRVRLDQIESGGWSWRGPAVAVTFDDGYSDNLHNAGPLLKRHDTPATFFVTTGGIDSCCEYWWDELERIVLRSENLSKYMELYEQLQPLQNDIRSKLLKEMRGNDDDGKCRPTHRSLTSTEVRTLASCDLFEIGAHTVTHPLLAAQPAEIQDWELTESKKWLQKLLDHTVTSVSYPYGGTHHYNRATLAFAEQAGYARACTTVPQTVGAWSRPWEWGRFAVSDMDGDQFERFLSAC